MKRRGTVHRLVSALSTTLMVVAQLSAAGYAATGQSVQERPGGGAVKAAEVAVAKDGADAPVGLTAAGVCIAGAVDLPTSPVVGTLDWVSQRVVVYRLTVSEGERFACVLTGDATLDADVYLFEPGTTSIDPGSAHAGSVGDAFPKRVLFDVPAGGAGVWYVAVCAASGSGGYTLAWTRLSHPAEPDDDIPGIDLGSPEGDRVGSLAWPSDTEDVYAIDIQEGQRIEVSLSGPSGADFDALLFGPSATTVKGMLPVFGSAGPSAQESFLHDVLRGEGGRYFVVVRAAWGSGSYTLRWKVSNIPVGAWEDFSLATELRFNDAMMIEGQLDRLTDVNDVYKIWLQAGQRLVISLTGDPGTDFDVYLHSPDRSRVIASAESRSCPDRSQADITAAGFYFIEVRSFTGSGGYRLALSVSQTPVFTEAERHAGTDRYQTAIAVSTKAFAARSVSTVVIASGEAFPDALTASGLAGCYGSPVLLTRPASLPSGLLAEIARLGARNVVIVGGPGALSDDVKQTLERAGLGVERLWGKDRYETANRVAARIRSLRGAEFAKIAFLVRGDDFADALAVAPAAYSLKAPVLLTKTTLLHPQARSAIVDNGVTDVYVAGGPGAVSDAVKEQAAALVVRPVVRLWGHDRYATAAQVASYATRYYWLAEECVYVATGVDFPDALGGGAAAGSHAAVLLLTRPTSLSAPAGDYLKARKGAVVRACLVGGEAALSATVKNGIDSLLR